MDTHHPRWRVDAMRTMVVWPNVSARRIVVYAIPVVVLSAVLLPFFWEGLGLLGAVWPWVIVSAVSLVITGLTLRLAWLRCWKVGLKIPGEKEWTRFRRPKVDVCLDLGYHSNAVQVYAAPDTDLALNELRWTYEAEPGKWEREVRSGSGPYRAAIIWSSPSSGSSEFAQSFRHLHSRQLITSFKPTEPGGGACWEYELRPKRHLGRVAVEHSSPWLKRAVLSSVQLAMQSLVVPRLDTGDEAVEAPSPRLDRLWITWPANTSQTQRKYVRRSAHEALRDLGWQLSQEELDSRIRLCDEPSAAAVEIVGSMIEEIVQGRAPGAVDPLQEQWRLAVADFGAGTLDIAIVEIEAGDQQVKLATRFSAAIPAAGDRWTALSLLDNDGDRPSPHRWYGDHEPKKESWLGSVPPDLLLEIARADTESGRMCSIALGLELLVGAVDSYGPDLLVLAGQTGQVESVCAVVALALKSEELVVPVLRACEIRERSTEEEPALGKSLVARGLRRMSSLQGGVLFSLDAAQAGAPWLAIAHADPSSPAGFRRSGESGHTVCEPFDSAIEGVILELNTGPLYLAYGFRGRGAAIPLFELRFNSPVMVLVSGATLYDLSVKLHGPGELDVRAVDSAPSDYHQYLEGIRSVPDACLDLVAQSRSAVEDEV